MGRHLDLLQLSTDGPISTAAWRAAKVADLAEDAAAARRAGCKIKSDSVRLTRKGLVLRMAGDLINLRGSKGYATKDDLFAIGWTRRDVDQLAGEAVPLANRRWNDRKAGFTKAAAA